MIFLPRRSRHDGFAGGTMSGKDVGNGPTQLLHLAVDEAAGVGGNEEVIIFRQDAPDVVGGLHGILHHFTHLHHTLRNLFQTGHERFESLVIDYCFLRLACVDGANHVSIALAIFLSQPFVHGLLLLFHERCSLVGNT